MKRLFTPEWIFPTAVDIPLPLRQEVGGSDLFLQMLVRRGFSDPRKALAFLHPDRYIPSSGYEFPDMEKAIHRILSALDTNEKIGIWGDFDVDGQTSTAVLVAGFRMLGQNVEYHVPVRGPESHGISIPNLQTFLESGVKLLITCDTGISANEAIVYAAKCGIDVIVTDHHTLPDELPSAYALIDPQFLPEDHPLCTLSGVGVAYKLIEALFSELGRSREAESLLDLVALGLLADLAILTGDARYLVQKGLNQIRSSPRLSLSTILSENEIPAAEVNEDTISYVIAPRLNAVGRLSDANSMVEFLLTDDPVFARTTTNHIEGLNADRKTRCDQVFQSAQALLEQQPKLLEKPLLFLGHPEWHSGVVGIVASRLVNLYHRPVILCNTAENSNIKGSARSIAGINITEAIHQNKHLLNSFGGHPMAAGLSFDGRNFDELRFSLYKTIDEIVRQSNYQPVIQIDIPVEIKDLNRDLVDELAQFAPFGPGNPPILFSARKLEIENIRPLGRTKEHEDLTLGDSSGNVYKVVWWQAAGSPHPLSHFDLAFSASLAKFRGKLDLRLDWQEFRDLSLEGESLNQIVKTDIENFDFRNSQNPEVDLHNFLSEPGGVVYSEGTIHCPVDSFTRAHLTPSDHLAFWTIPPSLDILQEIVEQVQPKMIAWFGNFPEENTLARLLKNVGITLKSASPLGNEATIDLEQLAEINATLRPLIKSVLSWYSARGDITLVDLDDDHSVFSPITHGKDDRETNRLQEQISKIQNEIIAFRKYYQNLESPSQLLSEKKSRNKKQQ
jgi:single-stranded-DNA-specific exonuclease